LEKDILFATTPSAGQLDPGSLGEGMAVVKDEHSKLLSLRPVDLEAI
jgi:hypothetical protein